MKLYRNEIRVIVLSKRELTDAEALSLGVLADITGESDMGDCVGQLRRSIVNAPMTPGAMVSALVEAGADPDFLFSVGVPSQEEIVAALNEMPPMGMYMRGPGALDAEQFAKDLSVRLERGRETLNDPPF